MPYIGNTPYASGSITRYIYTASGGETNVTQDDLSTPISYLVGSEEVYINRRRQAVTVDYTAVDGATISLTSTLSPGDVVEVVVYETYSPVQSVPSDIAGSVAWANSDYIKLPAGTTAQRPISPLAGQIRFNTDLSDMEYYDGTYWAQYTKSPYIYSVTGSITQGSPCNLTFFIYRGADPVDIVFYNNSSEVARVTDILPGTGSSIVAVPPAVYNLPYESVVEIVLEEANGKQSPYPYTKIVASLPIGHQSEMDQDGYRYMYFTSSANMTVYDSFYADVLLVAGGGAGGYWRYGYWAGGGGAGGYLELNNVLIPSGTFPVVVGAGGGNLGGDSIFLSKTAFGGGRGAWYYSNPSCGYSGGSGCGASSSTCSYGTGVAGQGNRGGLPCPNGAGGGGAGEVGQIDTDPRPHAGGKGKQWYDLVWRAGGGSAYLGVNAEFGGSDAATAGAANTGAGGGARYSTSGLAGGSGIVIIRFKL